MNKKIIYIVAGVTSIGLLSLGFIFMNNRSDTKEMAPGGSQITATVKDSKQSSSSKETKSHSEKEDIKTSEKPGTKSSAEAKPKSETTEKNENTAENIQLIGKFIDIYKQDSVEPNELKARETSLKELMTPDAFDKSGIAKETSDLIKISQQFEKDQVLNTNTNQSLLTYENVDSDIQFKNDHFEATVNSEAKFPSPLIPNYPERQRFTFDIENDKISNINIGEKMNTGA